MHTQGLTMPKSLQVNLSGMSMCIFLFVVQPVTLLLQVKLQWASDTISLSIPSEVKNQAYLANLV